MNEETRKNILAGAEQQGDDDKEYKLIPLADAFAYKRRGYHISNTDNPIDFPPEQEWDNWKPIKDIQ